MSQTEAMLEFLGAIVFMWPVHAIPAIAIAVPTALLTRKSFSWRPYDLLGLLLPWLVWATAFAFGPRDASLSSAVVESFALGCGVGSAYFLLVLLSRRASVATVRLGMLCSLCAAALAVWAFFPFLGE